MIDLLNEIKVFQTALAYPTQDYPHNIINLLSGYNEDAVICSAYDNGLIATRYGMSGFRYSSCYCCSSGKWFYHMSTYRTSKYKPFNR